MTNSNDFEGGPLTWIADVNDEAIVVAFNGNFLTVVVGRKVANQIAAHRRNVAGVQRIRSIYKGYGAGEKSLYLRDTASATLAGRTFAITQEACDAIVQLREMPQKVIKLHSVRMSNPGFLSARDLDEEDTPERSGFLVVGSAKYPLLIDITLHAEAMVEVARFFKASKKAGFETYIVHADPLQLGNWEDKDETVVGNIILESGLGTLKVGVRPEAIRHVHIAMRVDGYVVGNRRQPVNGESNKKDKSDDSQVLDGSILHETGYRYVSPPRPIGFYEYVKALVLFNITNVEVREHLSTSYIEIRSKKVARLNTKLYITHRLAKVLNSLLDTHGGALHIYQIEADRIQGLTRDPNFGVRAPSHFQVHLSNHADSRAFEAVRRSIEEAITEGVTRQGEQNQMFDSQTVEPSAGGGTTLRYSYETPYLGSSSPAYSYGLNTQGENQMAEPDAKYIWTYVVVDEGNDDEILFKDEFVATSKEIALIRGAFAFVTSSAGEPYKPGAEGGGKLTDLTILCTSGSKVA